MCARGLVRSALALGGGSVDAFGCAAQRSNAVNASVNRSSLPSETPTETPADERRQCVKRRCTAPTDSNGPTPRPRRGSA